MGFFASLERCYIIAEIGVNHGGDVGLAKRMVDAAEAAGADGVKFQTFTAERLVTRGTPKVAYQESTTDPAQSHFDMIKSLELSRNGHREVIEYCRERGIDVISTPYDDDSAAFLLELGVEVFKTASADIVDLPLHERLAMSGRAVIVSTGMATLGEVEQAVAIYRRHGHTDLALLHCVSNYPCSDHSLNLRAMETLAGAFGTPVGFSDHSVDAQAAVIAVALGACVVEKHFTLDKTMPGPDHKASSTPEEFRRLVDSIRRAETALGTAEKRCQPEERQMSLVSRKSVTLCRDVAAGHVIAREDLCLKRPGTGIPPNWMDELVGRELRRTLPADHLLDWADIGERRP